MAEAQAHMGSLLPTFSAKVSLSKKGDEDRAGRLNQEQNRFVLKNYASSVSNSTLTYLLSNDFQKPKQDNVNFHSKIRTTKALN